MTALLILDVDETLVRATDPQVDPPPPRVDFHVGPFPVMKRPHVDDFLRWCFASPLFKTAVWSAGSEQYVRGILRNLLLPHEAPAFVFTATRCTRHWLSPDDWYDDERFIHLKDLKKVRARGYDLDRVLALDDTPRAYKRSYGNLVRIRPFLGDHSDAELQRVRPFLEQWFAAPSVRRVEKRGW
ncbi:MAG: HAD family hydrolase [Myxococcales bacterium]|nr:HAD family hydrolase [Myxococcales bacterium]